MKIWNVTEQLINFGTEIIGLQNILLTIRFLLDYVIKCDFKKALTR